MINKMFFRPYLVTSLLFGLATTSYAQNAWSETTLDPTYRTVAPPHDDYPQNADHVSVVSLVLTTICLAAVGVSLTESKRHNSTVPAALTLGAATCFYAEALNCYLANVYWTVSHDPQQVLFTLLGRDFELYVAIVWWSFGSVVSCAMFAALSHNSRTGAIWMLLGAFALFDFVLEECMLGYGGVYAYYGHQPLVLFRHFPCWWAFGNTCGIFFGITVAYRYRNWFSGICSVFLLPLLPFCYVGPQVIAGLPTFYAIQADHSPLVTELCGVATCCIAVLEAGLIMDVMLDREPLSFRRTARADSLVRSRKSM